jgi:hypothetical protein
MWFCFQRNQIVAAWIPAFAGMTKKMAMQTLILMIFHVSKS